jgi:type VI protein secretion system component VasF
MTRYNIDKLIRAERQTARGKRKRTLLGKVLPWVPRAVIGVIVGVVVWFMTALFLEAWDHEMSDWDTPSQQP